MFILVYVKFASVSGAMPVRLLSFRNSSCNAPPAPKERGMEPERQFACMSSTTRDAKDDPRNAGREPVKELEWSESFVRAVNWLTPVGMLPVNLLLLSRRSFRRDDKPYIVAGITPVK